MKTQGNDPAMPLDRESIKAAEDGYGYPQYLTGLTKREEFAKAAMQGLLANPGAVNKADGTRHTYASLSEMAIYAADALIESLNKEK